MVVEDEGEAKSVETLDEDDGRAKDGGEGLDGAIIDLGLVNLVVVVGIRRVFLTGSAASLATFWVGDFRDGTGFNRLSPNTPEVGLLVVPLADVVAVVAPSPRGPARARARAAAAAAVEAPGLGNLLGDMFWDTSVIEVEVEAVALSFLISSILLAPSFLASSVFGRLPSPALGWRRERVRFSPVDADECDMVSRLQVVFSRAAA